MIQQWNEFAAPDQYGVEASNDIEPTVAHRLDGPYSDGWGYYYLDLVTKLIGSTPARSLTKLSHSKCT